MKLKDILLYAFGILSTCLVIYFSFINPILSGVKRFGAVNLILIIIVCIVALTLFMKLGEDERIQEPYKTIARIIVICVLIYVVNRLK